MARIDDRPATKRVQELKPMTFMTEEEAAGRRQGGAME
jgi:hypothetical protein